jgi:hypothetical protein
MEFDAIALGRTRMPGYLGGVQPIMVAPYPDYCSMIPAGAGTQSTNYCG